MPTARDGGRALGFRDGAVCLAENARHDAVADRRLIVASAGACRIEEPAEAAQRRRLVLIAPQVFEHGIIVFERRTEGLDRKRKDLLYQAQAASSRQRGVRQQRRRTWRTVDQRSALLDLQIEPRGKVRKKRIKRQDLAGSPLPRRSHVRQRTAVEHVCDGLCHAWRRCCIALDEIGKARQRERPDDTVGKGIAE